jgi:hypothetical protein
MPGWKFKRKTMRDDGGPPELVLPDQKNYEVAYGLAYRLARDKISTIPSIIDLCRRSGAIPVRDDTQKIIQLSYLNSLYRITVLGATVEKIDDPAPVQLRDIILILHYLLTASGRPLSGEWIGFQDLPEGRTYYPTFAQRVIQPLIAGFGNKPERLIDASKLVAGRKSDIGDFSVEIPAFPRVNLSLVIWRGDDEFPPNANVLFDRLVLEYLPLEDLIILCQAVVWKMVKALET